MIRILLTFILAISMNSILAQKYTETYIKDATKVASNWLENIHNNQYEKAYHLLSKEVKAIHTQENWIKFMHHLMMEFGEIKSRKMIKNYFLSSKVVFVLVFLLY